MSQDKQRYRKKRLEYLAYPIKHPYYRSRTVSRHIEWAGQDMIWEVSPHALQAKASHRIKELSKPTPNFYHKINPKEKVFDDPEYLYSVYGKQKYHGQKHLGTAISQERLDELAYPKYKYSPREDADAFAVPKTALKFNTTDRLHQLSRPKRIFQTGNINPEVRYSSYDVSSYTFEISKAAQKATSTERLDQLAMPKKDFTTLHAKMESVELM